MARVIVSTTSGGLWMRVCANNDSAAGILFLVLLIRFLAQLPSNYASPAVKGQEFMDILIVAVTVIVVAIPGKSPLVVRQIRRC